MNEIECEQCGWQGLQDELTTGGDLRDVRYDICPGCGEHSAYTDLDDEDES